MWLRGKTSIKNIKTLLLLRPRKERSLRKQRCYGAVLICWVRIWAAFVTKFAHLQTQIDKVEFHFNFECIYFLQTTKIVELQTFVPTAGMELYQEGIANNQGRGEITIYTAPISLSGANTLQNKSQCLSPNLVWQRVAARAILGSLWCQSPISPMTFFQRKSRFPRDSALCNFHRVFLHMG